MPLKPYCYWGIGTIGDGSTTQATFNLLTDPFVLGSVGAPGTGTSLSLTFALGLSNLPTGITVIAASDGNVPTASLGALGAVTFTWSTAIANGTGQTMYGRLEF